VTENDIAWWTGLNKGEVGKALQELEKEVSVEDGMVMFRADPGLLKEAGQQTVNLLPSLDPYVMGYKVRDRYLDKEHSGYVFDRSGNATSTIVVGGRIAGVWDLDRQHVKLFLFNDVKKDTLVKICEKARDVGRFMTGGDREAVVCENMTPLAQRTAGAVMSPLKDRSDL